MSSINRKFIVISFSNALGAAAENRSLVWGRRGVASNDLGWIQLGTKAAGVAAVTLNSDAACNIRDAAKLHNQDVNRQFAVMVVE
jgi:hypothetical protein